MSYLPLIIGLLPSFVWVYFFIREDEAHPEPKRLLIYAFLAGAIATFFVIGPQTALNDILESINIHQYSFASFMFLGGIEEVFKFLAVYLAVARLKDFDEPVDAMIYMIIAALGFAAVENIASVLHQAGELFGGDKTIEVASLRFIGATLLHSTSSAFVGYYWGMAMKKIREGVAMIEKRNFWGYIIEGVGIGTLLHAIFNSLILIYGPETLVATAFLVATSFFILNDFEKLKSVSS